MQTKTNKAVLFLRSGNFRAAISIIATFRIGFSKEERRILEIAKECLSGNVRFYKSIGIDVDRVIFEAKEIVKNKYLIDK